MLKKMMKKISSGITAALMCFSVMSALPAAVINVAAEGTDLNLDEPAHEKVLTSNGDGTYNLSLSVTGASKKSTESTKADVIVVFDASASMNSGGRLQSAKDSVNLLADELLAYNTDESKDNVRLSLVKFGSKAATVATNETSSSSFKNKVNGIATYSGDYAGTNWEDALSVANGISTRDDAEKYVIFVSDGLPTFRNTAHSYRACDWRGCWNANDAKYSNNWRTYDWYGNGSDDNQDGREGKNYSDAVVKAKEIVGSGKQLYTVNVYQNESQTLMSQLVQDAYNDKSIKDHSFHASNSTGLKNAFSNIVKQIKHSATYAGIKINDKLTDEVQTDSDPQFTYTVTDSAGNVKNNGLMVTNLDGSTTTLKPASYDEDNKTIIWDLGKEYQLEDGYTYKVSFKVYPTQETIDKITSYKKGEHVPEGNITDENGYYGIYTNEKATLDYAIVKDDTSKKYQTDYVRPKMYLNAVVVSKEWDDNGNQDGKRPGYVTVKLLANGKETDKTLTLNNGNEWKGVFDNLPAKDTNNDVINYTVSEVIPESAKDYYTATINSTNSGYTITNKHVPDTTSISVKKTWNDNNNQDGKRPPEVTVVLKENSNPKTEIKLNSGNNWSYTFTGLPVYKNGQKITYTVSENNVEDYTSKTSGDAENGYIITNSYTPETTSVSVTKSWDDANDQDGLRKDVTVELVADGVETKNTLTLSAISNWTGSFTGLAKNKDGKAIKYTVKENTELSGYESQITGDATKGFTITNKHTPETTSISVTKSWKDKDNQDGKRAKSIIVHLYADNVDTGKTLTLSAPKWTGSFTGLDKNKAGKAISYTVAEENIAGYTEEVTGSSDGGFVITNTHNPSVISISGSKTWDDGNDADGIRPDSIKVKLLANGNQAKDIEGHDCVATVTEENNWGFSFENVYEYANGKKITYTVEEETVASYTSSVRGNVTDGFTITNKHNPDITSITVSKSWIDGDNADGIRPLSIEVGLYVNDNLAKDISGNDCKATLSGENGWQYTFENLYKKSSGNAITYTVKETSVPNGYESSVNGNTVTNTHDPVKTSVTVTKSWDDANNQDGKRPGKITVNLLANGTVTQTQEVVPDANGNWTYTFDNLNKYENGKEIAYTVTEETVEGYTSSVTGDAAKGYTISNSYTPETTEISGTKKWDDNNNQDGKRPDKITVNLLANGTKIDSKTVTEKDNWQYNFGTLPVYESGQKITYTIAEDEVEDYSTKYDGYNVINSYTPEKTAVNVSKVWEDNNNQDGLRQNVTVKLFANDEDTGKTLTLSSPNWAGSFTDLDKYSNGEEIYYTVEEVEIDGYTPVVTRIENSNNFVITNIHTPATTSISGTKTWDDNNNQDGIRPSQVTINLVGTVNDDTVVTRTTSASADTNWEYKFENLPVYNNGSEIIYKVSETPVDGYDTGMDGTSFINRHTPSRIEKLSGTKTWDDNNNQDGKRPESITVRLLADGETAYHYDGTEVLPVTVTADSDGNWNYEFTDLPVYKAGNKVAYTVTEEKVEGYDATYSADGLSITNIHTPEKYKEIIGHKEWNDGNDVDGKRPESITVRLYADGTEVANQEVTGPDWNFRFENLDKYKEGQLIAYTVTEDAVEGYTTEITGDVEKGYTISNTHEPETIARISGTKTWDDNNNQDNKRPESITVRLYADGTEVASTTTDEQHSWYYEFTNLKKYREGEKGQEIVYTVKEDEVEGYTSTIDGYNITNTHELETMNISGEKVWDDADNQDGKRPESIVVHLYANGEEERTQTVTAENNWKFSFENLYKYRNGNPIRYSVVEEYVEGYEIGTVTGNAEDGFVITNKRTPELINIISGTKTWDDNNNQDGKRPESITVRLLADGEEVDSKTVTAANDWNYEFTNLPKYSDGKEITYTVTEDDVNGYTATVEGYNITNTHTPETVRINGQKVWNDNNNAGNTRPESITVQLYANGVQVAETTANKDLDWFFSFGELPVNANGEKITYTVTETPVEGYRSSVSGDAVNGFTVRNTLRPQTPTTDDKDPTITPTTPTKRRPQTPFTADTSNVALYGGLTLIALAAVIGILVRRREN